MLLKKSSRNITIRAVGGIRPQTDTRLASLNPHGALLDPTGALRDPTLGGLWALFSRYCRSLALVALTGACGMCGVCGVCAVCGVVCVCGCKFCGLAKADSVSIH